MKNSVLQGAMCVCLAAASFYARAATITFDNVSSSNAFFAGDFIDSEGYRFTNLEPRSTPGFQNIILDAAAPNNNGAALFNANDASLMLSAVDGSAFNLLNFDFARRPSDAGNLRSAELINITGTLFTGGNVTFQTGILQDGFLTALLPASFMNLTSVLFDPVVNSNNQPYNYEFLLDNVSVSGVSAVPLPAAAWLFGSGLLGLIGITRRKKAN